MILEANYPRLQFQLKSSTTYRGKPFFRVYFKKTLGGEDGDHAKNIDTYESTRLNYFGLPGYPIPQL